MISAFGAPILLLDSITEALNHAPGAVVVSGSHGGTSSGRYALQARPLLVVFNDAGVGKDGAGIRALAMLQHEGIAACAVAHHSARIGEAQSTWQDGVLSHVNAAALALGAQPGARVCEWLARNPDEQT